MNYQPLLNSCAPSLPEPGTDEAIEFTVPGAPVAKGRARAFIRAGHIAHYTPDKTARYENLVRLAAQQAMGGRPPQQGALALALVAHMPVPASWSQKKHQAAHLGKVFHTGRPDLDNIVKAVTDGCNGVLWHDDAQVVSVHAVKRYGAAPGVQVCVEKAA
jgi:Holliday junction resolvase RusA-like endonuclease